MSSIELLKTEIKTFMKDIFELDSALHIPDTLKMMDLFEWDSLSHITLLSRIQEHYQITFSPEEMADVFSLPQIIQLIDQKLKPIPAALADSTQKPFDPQPIEALLKQHSFAEEDVLYVHSQAKKVFGLCGGTPLEMIQWLLGGECGQRTVIFPAFPFVSDTYVHYLDSHPRFHAEKTPVCTGLLPELARKLQGAERSLHPVLSECAIGPKARWLTESAHLASYPFSPNSTYSKLVELDASVFGIGVDINTNALIHMIDDEFKEYYPFNLYMKRPIEFEIEFPDGHLEKREYWVYSPEIIRRIKPRKLRPFFEKYPQILTEFELENVWFYRLKIRPFFEKLRELAKQSLCSGRLPPWYQ